MSGGLFTLPVYIKEWPHNIGKPGIPVIVPAPASQWTYECKGKRKYLQRDSRSKELKRKLQDAEKRKRTHE